MELDLPMWGRPVDLVIKTSPVVSPSGNCTRVEVLVNGKVVIDRVPDMYPGDTMELTLRF